MREYSIYVIDYCFFFFAAGLEIGIFLEPLDLSSRKLIFFAVNDNDSRHSAGGSHWYTISILY